MPDRTAGDRPETTPYGTIRYPASPPVPRTDRYHGRDVADPFRWLEDDIRENPRVEKWVAAQNDVTFAYLDGIPERAAIRDRLTKLWNHEKFLSAFRAGGRDYLFRNDGLQNQFVLYTMDGLDEEPRVLIDPNAWSDDGTVALAGLAFSDDGRYAAYGVTESGSDWLTWRVKEIETGRILSDELKWVKFTNVAWTKDGAGFFYGRYPEPVPGAEHQSLSLDHKLYHHLVGAPQADDRLVYERPDEPAWGFNPQVTEDGAYLVVTVWKGTDSKYRILTQDLREPGAVPAELIGSFENEYAFVGNDGPILYFKTDLDAPRGRLIAVDAEDPRRDRWREVIGEAEETLTGVSNVGDTFIASYLRDARSLVKVFDMKGAYLRDVDLPGLGTAEGFTGRRADKETFYSFSSFDTPSSIHRYDLAGGTSRLLRRAAVDFDPDGYEVRQVFYESEDGTRVPMFLAHRKGIERDGKNPTLLYGYGGFNISLTPAFSIIRLAWMEMGGVVAVANLRGGGEYGEEWHRAGTGLNKQNVFDDFIAAAEWLIASGTTSKERLAIQGGSNGGLLVGAAVTQRPDLFAAALAANGVMDMLRFHLFTAGRFWVDDYGSPDDPEEFEALLAYSPYHNVEEGREYPAILITTADTDDRVVPGHSFKFAAALQKAQGGRAPVLIRVETRAGHGMGKPTAKVIEEAADQLTFLVKNLRMEIGR